jgi:small subunit ribosomal protein S1
MVTRTMQHTDTWPRRFAALIESDYDYTRPRRGEIYEATILSIGENDVVVDLGTKRDGIVPPRDLELINDAYRASLKVGDRVPVVVLKTWGLDDGIVVSINKGLQQQDWLRARELEQNEEIIEAEVTGVNRGGVLVRFGRLQGFVPNSHLVALPRGLPGNRLREVKTDLVGQTLSLTVIDVNQRRRRLVLSERVANRHKRKQLLQELIKGEVRTGIVRNLVDFGAFVDLGGVDGLIHISELSWQHVKHPSEVLSVGEEVDVYILDVDRERERIGLSRKRLLPDPWYEVTENLERGNTVEGTVTSVADFGAFVDLGKGVEGLVHISEMPDQEITHAVLEPGSPVTVSILEIDEWQRRIALRQHEADPAPVDETAEVLTPEL